MRIEGNAIIVSVRDLVRMGDDFWEVEGVHLGTVGQQDLYSLRGVTMRENPEGLALVPREFFEALWRSGKAEAYSVLRDHDAEK